jgi:hypothetical protein
MEQLEPTLSWESVVRGFYEASAQTDFAAARINITGWFLVSTDQWWP